MTMRQPPIDRFHIDHGTNDTRLNQINAQQTGTAYIRNSTTQELLPLRPTDPPDYRENLDFVLAAIRRDRRARRVRLP